MIYNHREVSLGLNYGFIRFTYLQAYTLWYVIGTSLATPQPQLEMGWLTSQVEKTQPRCVPVIGWAPLKAVEQCPISDWRRDDGHFSMVGIQDAYSVGLHHLPVDISSVTGQCPCEVV